MAKILIVEDTPANMRLLIVILEKAGHRLLLAPVASEGILIAQQEQPDLILMDVQLPGMNGLEATRLLKADPVTQGIPVIAITAFAMSGDKEYFINAGCDGYLAKPIRYKELLAAVENALKK
ncbi:response regulator [Iodobacter fluviatilis]|uniref:Polar-differentiation response regulator divK n=1 Tax=Iodobacter fluviatilis TaxID=537 RepID=A0A377Q8H8_9NEIS|nr:response regulator [Iodobacter fluviatilis]TCU88737.1 two-component system cell cycle response regulator DivK [Iodobacter fluviatilis]STQ91192.1 Polar-differentiation response regulator divK [Iodobacter fluviatilis]